MSLVAWYSRRVTGVGGDWLEGLVVDWSECSWLVRWCSVVDYDDGGGLLCVLGDRLVWGSWVVLWYSGGRVVLGLYPGSVELI